MADQRAELCLPSAPDAPALARDFLTGLCKQWEIMALLDLAILATSELVTNAVLHAHTEVRVEALLAAGVLTIGVHDLAPGIPAVVPRDRRGPLGGQGLAMVEQVAQEWGVDPDAAVAGAVGAVGKTVWCRLVVPED